MADLQGGQLRSRLILADMVDHQGEEKGLCTVCVSTISISVYRIPNSADNVRSSRVTFSLCSD